MSYVNVLKTLSLVVMLTKMRDSGMVTRNLLQLKGAAHLDKVLLLWNNQDLLPVNLSLPDIGVPILVIGIFLTNLSKILETHNISHFLCL